MQSRPLGKPAPRKENRDLESSCSGGDRCPSATGLLRGALHPKSVSPLCGCPPQACVYFVGVLAELSSTTAVKLGCLVRGCSLPSWRAGCKRRRTRSTGSCGGQRRGLGLCPQARLGRALLRHPAILKSTPLGPRNVPRDFSPCAESSWSSRAAVGTPWSEKQR